MRGSGQREVFLLLMSFLLLREFWLISHHVHVKRNTFKYNLTDRWDWNTKEEGEATTVWVIHRYTHIYTVYNMVWHFYSSYITAFDAFLGQSCTDVSRYSRFQIDDFWHQSFFSVLIMTLCYLLSRFNIS